MVKEFDNFILKSTNNLSYFNELASYIEKNEINIQNFFEIKNLTKKYVIQILPRNDFNNVLNALNINIKDYIRGNTNYSKREIDILELEDQRKTIAHK